MSENDKWTKANRLTKVIRHEIAEEVVGETLVPNADRLREIDRASFSSIEDGDSIWTVYLFGQTGFDKKEFGIGHYPSLNAAEKAVSELPLNRLFGHQPSFSGRFRQFCGEHNPTKMLGLAFGVDDEDEIHPICYDALVGAGVRENYSDTAQHVLDWVGVQDITWMKNEFGNCWQLVAELEYCLNHFSRCSLVCLATRFFFAENVSIDEFAAGYIAKQIKTIASGTEELATSVATARQKAGKGGGLSSHQRKLSFLNILTEEIEKRAGAVGLVSEDRIVEEALEAARAREPKFPKSKKTLDDYETALRSEEPFKSRYEAVFRKNA